MTRTLSLGLASFLLLWHVVGVLSLASSPSASSQQISLASSPSASSQRKAALLKEFTQDLSRLSELRPPDPEEDISAAVDLISDGSSYTRLWTQEIWNLHADPPNKRYLRHLIEWKNR
jgi:hypothetical protein